MKLFLEKLSAKDMNLPVIVRNYTYDKKPRHIYPRDPINYMQNDLNLGWSTLNNRDRRGVLKDLIDAYESGDIDISAYHLGHYCIYFGYMHTLERYQGDFSAEVLGKKRFNFFEKIPEAEFVGNDEFMATLFHSMMRRYLNGDRRNPSFSKVRLLFDPELYGYHVGPTYDGCDWVEPRSGRDTCWLHNGESRREC